MDKEYEQQKEEKKTVSVLLGIYSLMGVSVNVLTCNVNGQ